MKIDNTYPSEAIHTITLILFRSDKKKVVSDRSSPHHHVDIIIADLFESLPFLPLLRFLFILDLLLLKKLRPRFSKGILQCEPTCSKKPQAPEMTGGRYKGGGGNTSSYFHVIHIIYSCMYTTFSSLLQYTPFLLPENRCWAFFIRDIG